MNEIPISIAGRLATNPEFRRRSDGVAVAHFDVAVAERHQVGGEWRTRKTTPISCVAWRALAEHVHECLRWGDRVVVIGRLRQRDTDGEPNAPYRYDVTVEDLGASLLWTGVWPLRDDEIPDQARVAAADATDSTSADLP